jgi:hypothetical protein
VLGSLATDLKWAIGRVASFHATSFCVRYSGHTFDQGEGFWILDFGFRIACQRKKTGAKKQVGSEDCSHLRNQHSLMLPILQEGWFDKN